MMRNKSADNAKGDASMTDFQFKAYIELRDKYEALLQENKELKKNAAGKKDTAKEPVKTEEGMSDYQFQRYEKLRDKNEEMAHELALLREENAKLKVQAEMLKALSGDKK